MFIGVSKNMFLLLSTTQFDWYYIKTIKTNSLNISKSKWLENIWGMQIEIIKKNFIIVNSEKNLQETGHNI